MVWIGDFAHEQAAVRRRRHRPSYIDVSDWSLSLDPGGTQATSVVPDH